MAFADLSDPRAIEQAVDEFDIVGRDSFLKKYGFRRSREFFLEISGRRYDSKPIIAAAHGYQFPTLGPLKYTNFSGGEATVQRKLEALGFRVVVQNGIMPDFKADDAGVADERAHRLALWRQLQAIGQENVKPSQLNQLKAFYGGRGIWVDKARTTGIGGSVHGVTVGLLHTGSTYADDLSDDGVLYHYPQTDVPGRDTAEVEATKAAARLKLPVFVATYPSPSSSNRRVPFGWVEDWDYNERWFLVTFGGAAPVVFPLSDDTIPFAGINAKS